MSGFQKPNHTQTPNELFDIHMRDMEMSELKVVMAIIRQTKGWHRTEATYSIGAIATLTGMSWNSVTTGAEAAEKRGLIRRIPDSSPARWELVYNPPPSTSEGGEGDTPSTIEGEPPQSLRDLKEKKEKELNKPLSPSGEGEKIKIAVHDLEKLELAFAKARGCSPPDWSNGQAAEYQKRWRTPLRRMARLARGDIDYTASAVAEITSRMRTAKMTFDAPDQIEKTFKSEIIDNPPGKRVKVQATPDGGVHL